MLKTKKTIHVFISLILVGAAIAVAGDAGLTPAQLELWNSPEFQRQFTESYIAETDIEPRVTTAERDQLQKVLGLISSDKLTEAIAMLQKQRNDAASAVIDFTLANIYFQQEQFDPAAEVYQVAVKKYPKFRRAWRNLSLIHIRQGAFEKALPAMTKVIELGGGDAVTYGLLGYAYSTVNNFLSAESAYRMAILLDPATLDWKMGLARALFRQERFAEAVALCGQLIQTYPDRADLWLLQANAYIGLSRPLKAAEIYEWVDLLGQSSPESLYMLGDIYINEELYEMAVNAYIRAMDKATDGSPVRPLRSAKALAARGVFAQTRQIVDHIEQVYGEKLDTDSRKELLKVRARLAVAEGAGDEEVQVLEQIVALDPLDGEALILLGQHAARTDNTEKAVFYYERAAGLEKFEADAKVRHAQLLVGKGRYTEAIPLLKRAQTVNPRDNIQKYLEQIERVSKTQ